MDTSNGKLALLAVAVAVLFSAASLAIHPEGWTYKNGDYAYVPGTLTWHYLNAGDAQWVVDVQTGGWDTLANLEGWFYFNWPYAYSSDSGHWHWFNVNDVQWVCSMGNYKWSILGYHPAPEGMSSIPHGTNTGDDPDTGHYTVSAPTLYADRCEVSKALWNEVAAWANSNGYDIDAADALGIGDSYPAYNVDWYEAVKWCNARSEKEGLAPAYYNTSAKETVYRLGEIPIDDDCVDRYAGYRLPSSQEWEYMARGGLHGYRFPWGSDRIDHNHANYWAAFEYEYDDSYPAGYHPSYESGNEPHHAPVGDLTAGMNGYGLFDIAGNVFEWCSDWNELAGDMFERVIRGGSYYEEAAFCRVRWKTYWRSGVNSNRVGFRTVMPAKP